VAVCSRRKTHGQFVATTIDFSNRKIDVDVVTRMTIAANKNTANSYFERLLNQGDISVADAIFASGIRFHYPLGILTGVDDVKQYIETFRTAFPDIHFTVAAFIGEGDKVSARWSLAGTQTGIFKGQAPTGKKVKIPGITIFEILNGKIAEMWIAFDPALLTGDQRNG